MLIFAHILYNCAEIHIFAPVFKKEPLRKRTKLGKKVR